MTTWQIFLPNLHSLDDDLKVLLNIQNNTSPLFLFNICFYLTCFHASHFTILIVIICPSLTSWQKFPSVLWPNVTLSGIQLCTITESLYPHCSWAELYPWIVKHSRSGLYTCLITNKTERFYWVNYDLRFTKMSETNFLSNHWKIYSIPGKQIAIWLQVNLTQASQAQVPYCMLPLLISDQRPRANASALKLAQKTRMITTLHKSCLKKQKDSTHKFQLDSFHWLACTGL